MTGLRLLVETVEVTGVDWLLLGLVAFSAVAPQLPELVGYSYVT